MVKPSGAYLGLALMADAKAEGQHVCIGGWECLGGCLPPRASTMVLVGADVGLSAAGLRER